MGSDNLVTGCLACAAMRRMEFEASLKLEHTCKPVASAAVEHEVKSGSCWRRKADGRLVGISRFAGSVHAKALDNTTVWVVDEESDFRLAFTWECDPGEKKT